MLLLRLPNVLFGAMTIIVSYFALRLITTDPWTPALAASLVAFLPRFVFLSSFVTNDNLVDLLGAVLVFMALRYSLAPNRRRMAAVGLAFGLLLITKLSAIPLVVILLLLACLVTGWKRRVEYLGVGVASTLIVSGWYFVQNTVRYGDPLALGASANYLAKVNGLGALYGG
ncbi:MAG: glycosyltransferase family 39 protein, partial [Nitrososphaerales archaeon]